jgi:hypothetical protein
VAAAAPVGGVYVRVVMVMMMARPVVMRMRVAMLVMMVCVVVMIVMVVGVVVMRVSVARSRRLLCTDCLDLRIEQPGADECNESPAQGLQPTFR